jgi:hypothetical protein
VTVFRRAVTVVVVIAFVGAQRSEAQAGFGWGPFWQRPIHVGVDFGPSFPTGQYGGSFNPGWDVGGNVAVPISPHGGIWLQGDFNYASQLVTDATASAYGATGGGSSVTSGTLNIVLNKRDYFGNVTPYILGGGGVYGRHVELDNYAGAPYCSGFFGYCGVIGTAVPVVSRTEVGAGLDAGAGLRLALRPVRLFVEARYNNFYTHHGNTTFVPVVFGAAW